jgi:hypothetical protein
MKVLLVGAAGNMGSRYKAVLNYLGVEFSPYDITLKTTLKDAAKGCDRALICTPTDAHADSIRQVISVLKGPILCEKPITKNLRELRDLINDCAKAGCDLRMIYQYKKVYRDDGFIGPTHYDYYKSGGDGLAWDCIQLIGLARGSIRIDQKSPIWDAAINGQLLRIGLMDQAYIEYVNDWIKCPQVCVGPKEIIETHEKVQRLIEGANYGRT